MTEYNFNTLGAFARIAMDEYAQEPLLDKKTEKALFERRDEMRVIIEDKETCPETREWAEKELAAVRGQLIKANCRLVISIAKRFNHPKITLLDFINDGVLGLIKAIDKFDLEKGFNLSTYATWWIRQTISRALGDQGRTIRLPIHRLDSINKANKKMNEFSVTTGRDPTPEELSELMGLPPEKMRCILRSTPLVLSLDRLNTDVEGDESALYDVLEDGDILDEGVEIHMMSEILEEVLESFPSRVVTILKFRFGLDGRPVLTLDEIGKKLGVTRERVRQIEAAALKKLRHPRYSRKLRAYCV